MTNTPTALKVPRHLSKDSASLWRHVVGKFDLEPQHLRLLRLACESFDTAQAAQRELDEAGSLVVVDKYGQTKPNPLVNIARDARLSFARLMRELNLEEAPVDARVPRRFS